MGEGYHLILAGKNDLMLADYRSAAYGMYAYFVFFAFLAVAVTVVCIFLSDSSHSEL